MAGPFDPNLSLGIEYTGGTNLHESARGMARNRYNRIFNMNESSHRLTTGLSIAAAIALVHLLLHVVTNGNYGVSRDELYYLDWLQAPRLGLCGPPAVVDLAARCRTRRFRRVG